REWPSAEAAVGRHRRTAVDAAHPPPGRGRLSDGRSAGGRCPTDRAGRLRSAGISRRRLWPHSCHLRRRRPVYHRSGDGLGSGEGLRTQASARPMTAIVAYVPDLMDRSKVSAAAGDRVRFVGSPAELEAAAAGADLVVVDLSRTGVLEAMARITTRTIGFGSHVDTELL